MKNSVFRFNVSDENGITFPSTDPAPDCIYTLLDAYFDVLINDSFRLLRLRFDNVTYIISKYPNSPVYIERVPYYFTIKYSEQWS